MDKYEWLSLYARFKFYYTVVGSTRLTVIEIDALNFFQLKNLIFR